MISLQLAWSVDRYGTARVIVGEPQPCGLCARLSAVFVNRNGTSGCSDCMGEPTALLIGKPKVTFDGISGLPAWEEG